MKKLLTILLVIAAIGVVIFLIQYFSQEESTEEETKQETVTENETETVNYMDISVGEAYEMIQENEDLIIIDVSPNYADGHLPGAVNYYVGDGSLDEAIPNLDSEGDYLVYCHIDSAAISGAQKLIDAGFEIVYRLEGNYSAWVAAGYEVEK
jgi:rhodanese-related sulfurtransferase